MPGNVPKNGRKAEKVQQALAEIERIHAEYLGKMNAIRQRQHRLLKSMFERIDREKAAKILSSIKNGSIE